MSFPSIGITLDGDHTEPLRLLPRPIIARVDPATGRTTLDLRTIDPDDDTTVATALASVA